MASVVRTEPVFQFNKTSIITSTKQCLHNIFQAVQQVMMRMVLRSKFDGTGGRNRTDTPME